MSKAPIAVMQNENGEITAFMNIMPVYQESTISIDLMRHLPDEPSGEIDVMFIHLFEWAKQEGYRYFNLGMAPLSNVGNAKQSFLGERIAAAVFNNVRYLYGFKGLRDFKNKYYPEWSGKYLAYRKSYSLASAMIQVVRLIGGKKKKLKLLKGK
ncbi:phosphatidylglycerol lysyltransferase domain-containing protein [Virgibacillus halophilus]|uniref:Phosphatidylglycerol lysyltransferase domain-containing protein n=1 Tax=Tigheibacillus halophilus TaxID=361280 RepID=A0ABU5C9M4_9BACI|nr:phosphatidylglycerol lysyltransferase domain-containing protein [Virgibacillus halophilus]